MALNVSACQCSPELIVSEVIFKFNNFFGFKINHYNLFLFFKEFDFKMPSNVYNIFKKVNSSSEKHLKHSKIENIYKDKVLNTTTSKGNFARFP